MFKKEVVNIEVKKKVCLFLSVFCVFCSLFFVCLFYINLSTSSVKQELVVEDNTKKVKSIINDKKKDKKVKTTIISFKDSDAFLKYRVVAEIEFAKKTEIKKAMQDLEKLSSLITTSPSIKSMVISSVVVEKRSEGGEVEYIEVNKKD
jgi:hypothetical protein